MTEIELPPTVVITAIELPANCQSQRHVISTEIEISERLLLLGTLNKCYCSCLNLDCRMRLWMMKILAPPISAKNFFLHAQFPRERKVIYFFSSLSSSLATARYEIQHRSLITMKRFLLIRELPGTKCKLTNRECT